jgi:hypothetical protein
LNVLGDILDAVLESDLRFVVTVALPPQRSARSEAKPEQKHQKWHQCGQWSGRLLSGALVVNFGGMNRPIGGIHG